MPLLHQTAPAVGQARRRPKSRLRTAAASRSSMTPMRMPFRDESGRALGPVVPQYRACAACKPRPTTSWATIPRQMAALRRTRSRPICSGRRVLDIGCNAGFYSIEMKRRGAERVLGIDFDDDYLAPGALCRRGRRRRHRVRAALRLRRRRARRAFRPRAVHGRALPSAASAAGTRPDPRACRQGYVRVPVDAARQRRGEAARQDYPFWETELSRRRLSQLHFVEHRYAGDPTNWWIPNRACSEAMLRSAGFEIVAHPESEVYICRLGERSPDCARRLSAQRTGGERHDRSRDDLERAEQQVALGPGARSRTGRGFAAMAILAADAIAAEAPHITKRAWRHLADRSGVHAT